MRSVRFAIFALVSIMFCTVTAFAATQPIPDTGQVKCYDNEKEIPCPSEGEDFYGQDANYSINPMSYTKLDANGNDLPDSATSWAMVRDNVTGLIWENKTNDGTIHDRDNKYTWYDSNPETNGGYRGTSGDGTDTEDFIKALNDAKFGGYSDWRLPTINELAYIVDNGIAEPGPTINKVYFTNTQASLYWTRTTYSGATYLAWSMNFYNGGDYGYKTSNEKNYAHYVMAVRGEQTALFDNLIINGDGTVTDTNTGLMWQQATGKGTGEYIDSEVALSYCEYLNLGGYTDWRLPTLKELRSIVDYSNHSQAINTFYFSNTYNGLYRTSTNSATYNSYKWVISFSNGEDEYDNYYASYYVRAVRNVEPVVVFEPVLSVIKTGTGDGSVSSVPAGIDCGGDCSEIYQTNTIVTLTATPDDGSAFDGWSGACSGTGECTVTMSQAKSVTAAFTTSDLPAQVNTYIVLTNKTPLLPALIIQKGYYAQVFGSDGGNSISIASGGRMEGMNFVGANVVNIEDSSSQCSVYRSGAAVYITSNTGTLVKIPATKTVQTLRFFDGSSGLVIDNGRVKLGNQEITPNAAAVGALVNPADTSAGIF